MVTSKLQHQKAAKALADLLADYGLTPKAKVTRFREVVERAIEAQKDTAIMGVDRTPDKLIREALKKVGLEENAISHVIMITFEPNDQIRVFLDGRWTYK